MKLMLPAPEIGWTGYSGEVYQYQIYDLTKKFSIDRPGNYIYAQVIINTDRNEWEPLYIGQTDNLSLELILDTHPKGDCIIDTGATHILVHLSDFNEDTRIAETIDLIKNYKPICND